MCACAYICIHVGHLSQRLLQLKSPALLDMTPYLYKYVYDMTPYINKYLHSHTRRASLSSAYYNSFCDKCASAFFPRFTAQVLKIRRVSDTAVQQVSLWRICSLYVFILVDKKPGSVDIQVYRCVFNCTQNLVRQQQLEFLVPYRTCFRRT